MTLISAVAVAEAVMGELDLLPQVKWPNDVLVNNRKLAGILLQSRGTATCTEYAVIGIGVNVNHTAADLGDRLGPVATSLRLELGRPVERIPIFVRILAELETLYERAQRGEESAILQKWRRFSATLGEEVQILQDGRLVEGLAVDIADDGALVVQHRNGSSSIIHAGDVHVVKRPVGSGT
jgi:BirA family biotin operon repressor/biotin-[acetyl-CoA-carboxylase] ligase